jgi:hypothetical protein
MEGVGIFITIMVVFFLLPYVTVIIIFGKKKQYNIVKLLCGITFLWILLSIIFTFLIYLITGGTINTKNGIESSLLLSSIIGGFAGCLIAFLGSLHIIEKVGINGVGSLANDIISNSDQYLIVRLLNALVVFLFGLPVKLIYKWAKKQNIE